MADRFAGFLDPPKDAPPASTSRRVAAPSSASPYSADPSTPYVQLDQADWFRAEDHDRGGLCQIQEIILVDREPGMPGMFDEPAEYRGYGRRYLKDGRTFAARGLAQFVLLNPADVPPKYKEALRRA